MNFQNSPSLSNEFVGVTTMDSFFLDNRATHHVTVDGKSLNAKTEYSGTGKLSIGDGSRLSISHIGNIKLPTSQPLMFRDTLLVPSIAKNLISISKFTLENDCDAPNPGCPLTTRQPAEILCVSYRETHT